MLFLVANATSTAAKASRGTRFGGRSISVVATLGIPSSPSCNQNDSPTSAFGRRQHPVVVTSSSSLFSMTPSAVFMSTATEDEASKPMIHSTIESIRSYRKTIDNSLSVGFVPTMGALHEGAWYTMMHVNTQSRTFLAYFFNCSFVRNGSVFCIFLNSMHFQK